MQKQKKQKKTGRRFRKSVQRFLVEMGFREEPVTEGNVTKHGDSYPTLLQKNGRIYYKEVARKETRYIFFVSEQGYSYYEKTGQEIKKKKEMVKDIGAYSTHQLLKRMTKTYGKRNIMNFLQAGQYIMGKKQDSQYLRAGYERAVIGQTADCLSVCTNRFYKTYEQIRLQLETNNSHYWFKEEAGTYYLENRMERITIKQVNGQYQMYRNKRKLLVTSD